MYNLYIYLQMQIHFCRFLIYAYILIILWRKYIIEIIAIIDIAYRYEYLYYEDTIFYTLIE